MLNGIAAAVAADSFGRTGAEADASLAHVALGACPTVVEASRQSESTRRSTDGCSFTGMSPSVYTGTRSALIHIGDAGLLYSFDAYIRAPLPLATDIDANHALKSLSETLRAIPNIYLPSCYKALPINFICTK